VGRLWALLPQVWSFQDHPGRSGVAGDDIPDRQATDGGATKGMAFAAGLDLNVASSDEREDPSIRIALSEAELASARILAHPVTRRAARQRGRPGGVALRSKASWPSPAGGLVLVRPAARSSSADVRRLAARPSRSWNSKPSPMRTQSGPTIANRSRSHSARRSRRRPTHPL
jgi:hypothetical protein